MDAESEQFSVAEVFQQLGVAPKGNVFLYWFSGPTSLDEIDYTQFCQYFDYIWYPSSDDLLIFDNTLSWILSVSHEGEVQFSQVSSIAK